MDDYRIRVGFLDHPKTMRLKRRLGPEAVEYLLRLFEFATSNPSRRAGDLAGLDAEGIADACRAQCDPHTLCNALAECGWLDGPETGWKIHDWREINPFVATWEERSEKAKCAANARWKRSNAGSMPPACATHAGGNAPSPTPTPTPTPTPNPKTDPKLGATVSAVADHYVSHFPRRQKQAKSPKVRRKIAARLSEGYTADDLRLAIDGNRKSEFHRDGGHDSLELIMRDASKVDRFIAIAKGEVSGKNGNGAPALKPAPNPPYYKHLNEWPGDKK